MADLTQNICWKISAGVKMVSCFSVAERKTHSQDYAKFKENLATMAEKQRAHDKQSVAI